MEHSDAFIMALVYGIPVILYFWWKKRHPKAVATEPLDFVQASEIIERLNATKNRLQDIEDLLTSAQLCSEDHSQAIKCSWNSCSNRDGYIFTVNDSSNEFVSMAQNERVKLRTSLLSDVDELCNLRFGNGITKSVTQSQSNSKGERG